MDNSDLGLGDRVAQENRTRFVNKDGSFNIHRKGVLNRSVFSPYHAVLNASWWRFNLGILGYYLSANIIFTVFYFLSGRNAFPDIANMDAAHRFGQLFFYSVQVITTLGTSPLHPANTMADAVLGIEAMVGLLGFALGASLLFARFSNPPAKILFSEQAIIAPYNNITGLMVRIINGRSNELINVSATMTLVMEEQTGHRTFKLLPLERDQVQTFPVNWTMVHPINSGSPLFGKTYQDLKNAKAEVVVNVTAVDRDLSKTVYVRSSYSGDEIVFGVKFVNIIERDAQDTVVVDPQRVGEIEKV
jgi:inward rectifier potassium channel